MDIFVKGNSKMGSDVLIFNLPPIQTCRPSEWCKENCYALMGNHRFPLVRESWQKRLEISKQSNFAELAVKELKMRHPQYVRLHSAGDFYSIEYARKWIEIIKQCSEIIFRTTTKRIDLAKVIQELDSLPNMIVRESLDISRQAPSGILPSVVVIDGTPTNRKLFFCLDNCAVCDYTCWKERVSTLVLPRPKS